jgi:3-oxoacyl-[acyl-carrier protein] reductase
MDLGLNNRVAFITASSRGLGYAAAAALVGEGARVAICGRDSDSLAEAAGRLADATPGAEVETLCGDLSEPSVAEAMVRDIAERSGRLDILITNAGGPPAGRFESLELTHWERGFRLTLLSAVSLLRAAIPYLRQSDAPSVLTIGSVSARQPIDGLLLSNVFRPAIAGLTKSLATELAGDGIRINSILPGWTATERVEEILAHRAGQAGTDIEIERAKITEAVPLRRMGRPEEFGRAAAFLVSPAASYITGVLLPVDGGSIRGY